MKKNQRQTTTDQSALSTQYPHLWEWVRERGWVELGRGGHLPSFARVLDEGGMIWEGKGRYKSFEDVLQDIGS